MLAKARHDAAERRVTLNLFRTPLEELRVAGRFDAAYSILQDHSATFSRTKTSPAHSLG